jgi:magnesium-transporting ATPase (P-type)
MEKITINRIYPFKSELKRMSTLVEHVEENGTRKYKVLCKGAPEAI